MSKKYKFTEENDNYFLQGLDFVGTEEMWTKLVEF